MDAFVYPLGAGVILSGFFALTSFIADVYVMLSWKDSLDAQFCTLLQASVCVLWLELYKVLVLEKYQFLKDGFKFSLWIMARLLVVSKCHRWR